MKRRDFTISGLAGIAAGLASEKTEAQQKKAISIPKPYGIRYFETAREIWVRESTSELPIIAQAADAAAKSLKNGNKLYGFAFFGHMLVKELRTNRPGNPGYLPTGSWQTKDEDFDPIGKGDFIFFDETMMRVKKAHDRGAFVVGARVPYLPNKTTPKGVLATYEATDNLLTEDVSDLVLTSGVPFTNGCLYYPEIPAVRGCPISVQGVGNFYWMLSAEIAMRDKGGAMGGTAKAREYIDTVKRRGALIRANFDKIDATAKAMAGFVAQGGKYWNYTFGNEMADENIARASGLAMSHHLSPEDIASEKKAGGFVVIGGEASDTRENIQAADAFRAAGFKVIYIGPGKTEGGSGDDMPKHADFHLETFSPEREGTLAVPGIAYKICPTTGVLFALTLWMMNAQFISHMIAQDMTPGLDMGGHIIGGNAYNSVMRPIVEKRGY